MPGEDDGGDPTVVRRDFLRLAGTGVATALAGCVDGSQSGPDPDEGSETVSPSSTSTETVPPEERRHGGTLTVAMESDLTGLDPHATASVVSWNVIYNVCETLLTFDGGTLAGRLARSYETGDDARTFSLTLREGVRFHDPVDRELVAEDVVYSFRRMQRDTANMAADTARIDSVEATSRYEVTFRLDGPFAPFLQFLARVPWVIVPEEAVENQGGDVGSFQKPVGTGPFVLENHDPGDEVVLRRFDDYHEEAVPYVDEVRLLPVPDGDARVLALRKGDVDVARNVPGKDATTLADREDVRVVESRAAAWGQVYINCAEPPWDDPAVRRAVAHVLNREAVVEAGLFGYGSAAWQPFPPSSFWHTEQDGARERDVEKARQILDDAGNPLEGETLEIKTTTAYGIMETTADVLQSNLSEADIDAEIRTTEWGTMLSEFLDGEFGAMAFSVPHKVDPDRYFYNFIHPDSPQYVNYGTDQPDAQRMYDLLEEARTTTDRDERRELYGELQGLVDEHVPWISVALQSNVMGTRDRVRGDPTWLLPYNRLWRLSLAE